MPSSSEGISSPDVNNKDSGISIGKDGFKRAFMTALVLLLKAWSCPGLSAGPGILVRMPLITAFAVVARNTFRATLPDTWAMAIVDV
jgi:hypothetical protein